MRHLELAAAMAPVVPVSNAPIDRARAERERQRRYDVIVQAQHMLKVARINPIEISMERLKANVFHLVAPQFTRATDDH